MTQIEIINEEINRELANASVSNALLATTFKGLKPVVMKQAIMEGMMRGFEFKDFLEKNVYAIPFKDGYSLITSIDYARKIGMRSGVVGVSAPTYELGLDEGKTKVVSCTITVKKRTGNDIGDYSATVYFDEYYKAGYNGRPSLWDTKPRTMIAKVAEMHALRKACPEELSQAYTEEEMIKETVTIGLPEVTEDIKAKVEATKTEAELKAVWEQHKGLGKDFAKMVVAQKAFLKEVTENENATA